MKMNLRWVVLASASFLAFSTFAEGHAWAGELRGIRRNNEGVKLFEKRPADAYDRFTDALAEIPDSARVHYNIATTFLANKDFEKALAEYGVAIRLANLSTVEGRETQFAAIFNSAVALGELKRTDQALEMYQRALEIVPNSLETKTNIELLTKGGGQGDGKGDPKDDQDGKGEGKDKKDDPKDQGKDKKDQPQKFENQGKPTPRPFKSEELNQQDVGRILDELKQQEEQVRAKMQNEGAKDVPTGKDW